MSLYALCTPDLVLCSRLRGACVRLGQIISRDMAADRNYDEDSAVKANQEQVENEKKEQLVTVKRKSRSGEDFLQTRAPEFAEGCRVRACTGRS